MSQTMPNRRTVADGKVLFREGDRADCAYIINHCDAELVFVENNEQLAKILEVRADLTNLRHIVIYDGRTDPANEVISWDDFLARADEVDDDPGDPGFGIIEVPA